MQAAAAVLITDKADIVTAAHDADFDLVLLHLIADPASANQRNDGYNTRPHTAYAQTFILYKTLLPPSAETTRTNPEAEASDPRLFWLRVPKQRFDACSDARMKSR